jgi:integrase
VNASPGALPDALYVAGGTATNRTAGELDLERLGSLLDPDFLKTIRWDPAAQAFAPPPEHPQLGWPGCLVSGCDTVSYRINGLCSACQTRYRTCGLDLPAFMKIERVRVRARGFSTQLCAVADCGRPIQSVPSKLCSAHADQRYKLALPLATFLIHPRVRALPPLGECRVAACRGPAHSRRGLCRIHDARWLRHRRLHPEFDLDHWCEIQQPPRNDPDRVVLLGLPSLVQTQLLYGLQERCKSGSKTKMEAIRSLCGLLRHGRLQSILELELPPPTKRSSGRTPRPGTPSYPRREPCHELAAEVQTAVKRAFSSPELERRKDKWDMAIFGHRGTLDFTEITQPWLRQAAKDWASEDVPKRRGDGVTSTVQTLVRSLGMLSASLRLQRDDQGMDPTILGRADLVAFLNRLAHLQSLEGESKISADERRKGEISPYQRRRIIRQAAMLLRDCRALGLTRPGRPLAGLPDDFAFRPGDAPKEPADPEQGKALPEVVLRQLVAALPQLETSYGREISVAVQLLMDTGRRPDEICKLPWDCVEQDPDGKYALVYTDFKNNRIGVRLAIADATARLIIEQQQAVRDRFPNTAVGQLVLLPRAYRNPHGIRALTDKHLARLHRQWIKALPVLWSGERTEDGTEIEFDKARVSPKAYRHTYAQRHADNGTPVEELRALMGHDSLTSTQIYFRVTAKRTRAAVDKLAALQFDGRGNRIWRQARALLEHEHQRLAVGQVAVPFGICTEPSNVQAGGHACPFRFRCVGCGHFRSDPSYLPELRGYLDMLLRNRERVRAAVELEEWARAEAMPSDEEISRVRALIRRAETDLEQLSEEEHQQIDEACRIVRAARQTVHLGMPTIRTPDLDPTLPTNREELA